MPEQQVTPDPTDRSESRPRESAQREQAYARLRLMLLLRQTPGGRRLREAEWAARLQVNRTALREAFARLEAEGLIEKGPVTGYFIPACGQREFQETVETRIMLECGAVERICRHGFNTPGHLQELHQTCDQLERLLTERLALGAAEVDRRFHDLLVAAAGSRRLSMLYLRVTLPLISTEVTGAQAWTARVGRAVSEHRQVLSAMAAGDVAAARSVLEGHLRDLAVMPLFAT